METKMEANNPTSSCSSAKVVTNITGNSVDLVGVQGAQYIASPIPFLSSEPNKKQQD